MIISSQKIIFHTHSHQKLFFVFFHHVFWVFFFFLVEEAMFFFVMMFGIYLVKLLNKIEVTHFFLLHGGIHSIAVPQNQTIVVDFGRIKVDLFCCYVVPVEKKERWYLVANAFIWLPLILVSIVTKFVHKLVSNSLAI